MDYQESPVQIQKFEGGVRIAVIGSVHTNVSWLESEFKKVIAMNSQRVELDLSRCDFLSSTGIGLLVYLHTSVAKAGGKMTITAIKPQIMQSLRFAGLQSVLDIAPAAKTEAPKPAK